MSLSRSPPTARPAVLAALCLGATIQNAWLYADVALAVWAMWAMRRSVPPWQTTAVALAILPGLLWTDSPVHTATAAVRVFALGVVGVDVLRHWDGRAWAIGLAGGALAPIASVVNHMSGGPGVGRAHGLTDNASVLGQVSVVAWAALQAGSGRFRILAWLASALTMAGSLARASALAIGGIAVLGRDRRALLAVVPVGLIFIVSTIYVGMPERLFVADHILEAAGLRFQLTADQEEIASQQGGEPAELTSKGYGAGGSYPATGTQRPHNWPQVVALELGLLAVVPALVAVWALCHRALPVWWWVGMLPLAVLTDEMVAVPAGHYLLAATLLPALALRRREA